MNASAPTSPPADRSRTTRRKRIKAWAIVLVVLTVMVGMVLKMIGRWVFNLKYVIFMPEIFFNI